MSFADPTLTISGTAVTLARTGSGIGQGTFSSSDGTVRMSVSNQNGKRFRRIVRVDSSKVSADPLIPTQNVRNSMSVYMVVDVPVNGYTVTEQKALVDAFTAYLTASSGARVTQLLGGEN